MTSSKNCTCLTCGNNFSGKYCNQCGEKVYDANDKSFRHLIEEVLHFFTHFDGKFFKTLKLVLFKTGSLSRQYCNGIRKPFFKPVSLFFICIISYLLFPVFGGLNMKFYTYTNPQTDYHAITRDYIQYKTNELKISQDQLSVLYNNASPKFAKVFILLFLPLSALALMLLFFSSKKYFFDHFILATELNTFFVFVSYLLLPLIMSALLFFDKSLQRFFWDGGGLYMFMRMLYIVVTAVALHRFYNQHWMWTIIKAIAFIVIFNVAIKFAYNIILFWIVMWSL